MRKVIVAGIGTGVGKTIASAILTTSLKGDYWKPIQCGNERTSDTRTMKRLLDPQKHQVHSSFYSLSAPLSPHHAARLENLSIDCSKIIPPYTKHPLIIEGVGGIFVPLTLTQLTFDLFRSWEGEWIVVSRHYLGSINHTLMTLEILKSYRVPVLGLIFNGTPCPDSEEAILGFSHLPLLGRLLPERAFNRTLIQEYAKRWTLL